MKPIEKNEVYAAMKEQGISDMSRATIRQCVSLAKALECRSGEAFVHLELGIPGLNACQTGVDAQKKALDAGLASVYPPAKGIPEFKENGAAFVKAFTGIDVKPSGVIPTAGSMQACYNLLLECSQLDPDRRAVVYLDPGFPSHYVQANVLGLEVRSFDLGTCRGEALRSRLEEMTADGRVCAIVYSNPNNPSWMCLTEGELKEIGKVCTEHDVVALEDLAYFCMDFRRNLSVPGQPPYQPTVARYTENWVMMLSASKIFSYAGERIAAAVISDSLYDREYGELARRYGMPKFGENFALTFLYVNTSSASHSAQCALAAMFGAASCGVYDFVGDIRRYAERAARAKDIFFSHGFTLAYSEDMGEVVGDGFFFTVSYGDMSSAELQFSLLRCGVCTISLAAARGTRSGVRVCVALLKGEDDFVELDERLRLFSEVFG